MMGLLQPNTTLAAHSLDKCAVVVELTMLSLVYTGKLCQTFFLQSPSLPKFGQVCSTCLHYETLQNFCLVNLAKFVLAK